MIVYGGIAAILGAAMPAPLQPCRRCMAEASKRLPIAHP
jgi:hypothetical protein